MGSGEDPSAAVLTAEERDILVHTLTGGTGRVYRNHYVTGPGCDGYETCRKLVARGYMKTKPVGFLDPTYVCFFVTLAGARAVWLMPTEEKEDAIQDDEGPR